MESIYAQTAPLFLSVDATEFLSDNDNTKLNTISKASYNLLLITQKFCY